MRPTIALVTAALLLVGCASPSKVATTKLQFQTNGKTVTVISPKDVSFDSVTVNPETGVVDIRNYRSVVDAGAVEASKAQAASQAQVGLAGLDAVGKMSEAMRAAAEAYGRMQGLPVPATKGAAK